MKWTSELQTLMELVCRRHCVSCLTLCRADGHWGSANSFTPDKLQSFLFLKHPKPSAATSSVTSSKITSSKVLQLHETQLWLLQANHSRASRFSPPWCPKGSSLLPMFPLAGFHTRDPVRQLVLWWSPGMLLHLTCCCCGNLNQSELFRTLPWFHQTRYILTSPWPKCCCFGIYWSQMGEKASDKWINVRVNEM